MTIGKKECIIYLYTKTILTAKAVIYHCGDVSGEVPPVPIPNTEVKLAGADNTRLATAREDRLLPDLTSPFTE